MNFTAYLALLGWPLVALTLCATLPPRRAVIAAFIGAWLFLPMASLPIPGLPDWTKLSATCISLLAGVLIFDFERLSRFRPSWIDLPMAAWCLCPIASSLTNTLGLYDGLSTCLFMIVTWGLPYIFGRLYFADMDGLRELAIGVFLGGLAYIPFCLFEIRMSPQLHTIVYGYNFQGSEHSHRFGGWRPAVFMAHGLMVGMWMTMSSLVGLWLWTSGTLRRLRGIALPWFLVPLVVTAILCKSAGAVVLLLVGILILAWFHGFRNRAPMHLLGIVAPLYILVRISGLWSGAELVEAAKLVSAERASSLATRFDNEDRLSDKAMKQAVFGWGGWGRSRVYDDSGRDISITDGLWIIEFGSRGLVGLTAMLGVFLLPIVILVRRVPVREWTRAWGAPAAALTTVVGLYLVDCIANAMITPIFILAAGGLTGLTPFRPVAAKPAAAEPRGDEAAAPTGS